MKSIYLHKNILRSLYHEMSTIAIVLCRYFTLFHKNVSRETKILDRNVSRGTSRHDRSMFHVKHCAMKVEMFHVKRHSLIVTVIRCQDSPLSVRQVTLFPASLSCSAPLCVCCKNVSNGEELSSVFES